MSRMGIPGMGRGQAGSNFGAALLALAGREAAGRQGALRGAARGLGSGMTGFADRQMQTTRMLAQMRMAEAARKQQMGQQMAASLTGGLQQAAGRRFQAGEAEKERGHVTAESALDRANRIKAAEIAVKARGAAAGPPPSNLFAIEKREDANAVARSQIDAYLADNEGHTWIDARNAWISGRYPESPVDRRAMPARDQVRIEELAKIEQDPILTAPKKLGDMTDEEKRLLRLNVDFIREGLDSDNDLVRAKSEALDRNVRETYPGLGKPEKPKRDFGSLTERIGQLLSPLFVPGQPTAPSDEESMRAELMRGLLPHMQGGLGPGDVSSPAWQALLGPAAAQPGIRSPQFSNMAPLLPGIVPPRQPGIRLPRPWEQWPMGAPATQPAMPQLRGR